MRYNNYLRTASMLLITLALVSTGTTVLAQLSDSSLSLCDYTVPETTYQDLGLSFHYLYYDDPNLSTEGDINKGSVSGNYAYIYANPDYSINLDSDARLSLSDSELTYDAYSAGRYNFYPIESDLFAFGGIRVDFSDGFSEVAGVRATTGSGFGRFKNVTPLVKAVLIEDMLKKRGALSGDLTDDSLRKIARAIGGIDPETETESVVDRIVAIVEGSSALELEKLGAIEVLRIREMVEERIDGHLCGWEIRAGLAYEVLDPQGEDRDFLLDAAARYAYPFAPYSQLLLEANFASTLQVTENFTVKGLVDYTYRFNENLDADLKYSVLYQQGETGSFYHQNLSASTQIRISTNLSASAALSLSLDENYEEMAKEITVGVSYDLL